MPSVLCLQPGDPRRIGRYRLSGRLAGSPSGTLSFLASRPDGPPVTLNLLDYRRIADPAARDRFAAEAAAAARVRARCVVPIRDFGVDEGLPYLVTDYVPCRSLREDVTDRGPHRGPGLRSLALGTAAGLAAIHRAGLVHGSFGPDHVLLAAGGPQLTGYSVTPPYGRATPAADMRAWALALVYAATAATRGRRSRARVSGGTTGAASASPPCRTGYARSRPSACLLSPLPGQRPRRCSLTWSATRTRQAA